MTFCIVRSCELILWQRWFNVDPQAPFLLRALMIIRIPIMIPSTGRGSQTLNHGSALGFGAKCRGLL